MRWEGRSRGSRVHLMILDGGARQGHRHANGGDPGAQEEVAPPGGGASGRVVFCGGRAREHAAIEALLGLALLLHERQHAVQLRLGDARVGLQAQRRSKAANGFPEVTRTDLRLRRKDALRHTWLQAVSATDEEHTDLAAAEERLHVVGAQLQHFVARLHGRFERLDLWTERLGFPAENKQKCCY